MSRHLPPTNLRLLAKELRASANEIQAHHAEHAEQLRELAASVDPDALPNQTPITHDVDMQDTIRIRGPVGDLVSIDVAVILRLLRQASGANAR